MASRSCQKAETSVSVVSPSWTASFELSHRLVAAWYRHIVTATEAAIMMTTARLTRPTRRAGPFSSSFLIVPVPPRRFAPANLAELPDT